MKISEMTCREMFERLSEYIDGELEAELCKCFDRHAQNCEPCAAFIRTLRKTVEWCKDYETTPVPEIVISPKKKAPLRAAYERCLF